MGDGGIMCKEHLEVLSRIQGFVGGGIVDAETGISLGFRGGAGVDMELAGSMLCDMMAAHEAAKDQSGIQDTTDEIIVTLDKELHMLRPVDNGGTLFVHLVLDKAKSNLGKARLDLKQMEQSFAA